jgi:hypothetical protein
MSTHLRHDIIETMKKLILTLIGGVIALTTMFGQAKKSNQDTTWNKFGKGITIVADDNSFKMKFSTRFQQLFIVEMPENGSSKDIYSNFLIRRARLKFDGHAFSPRLKYKVELGMSNRDIGGVVPPKSNTANIILDAVAKWKVAGNLELWAGQTKLPGNRERVISSQKLQFVDRSLVNSRYNIDRDMGIQIRHHFKAGNVAIREAFAFSQGEGRNITAGNSNGGYQYTGRIEILPFGEFTSKGDYFSSDLKREQKPKLAIGVTYDYNNLATRERGNNGSFVPDSASSDLNALMADLMFKFKGLSIMVEYVDKQASHPILLAADSTMISNFYEGTGLNAQIGYLFEKSNIEVAARFTNIVPVKTSGRDIQDMYTLGLSKYIVGHSLKVQTDFSYLVETDQFTNEESGEYLFRLQCEVSF